MLTLSDVLRAAEERLAAGDGRGALEIYRQVLDRNPNNSEALMGAFKAAILVGEPAAIEAARRPLEQLTRNAGAMAKLAVAQTQLNNALRALAEAAEAAKQALAGEQTLPEADCVAYLIGHHLGNLPQFFSQFGQDRYLNEVLFKHRKGGVFVDVGAYDGLTGSNTLFYEKFLGWSGLCIEPDAAQFARLTNIRSCACVRTCIADKEGSARFLNVSSGLTQMGGLVDYYEPQDMKMVSERSAASIVPVTTRRLDAVLSEHKIEAIDYLSIDTEGSELAILKSFDLARFQVRALSVENNRNSPQIPDYLQNLGYRRLVRLGVDDLYARA